MRMMMVVQFVAVPLRKVAVAVPVVIVQMRAAAAVLLGKVAVAGGALSCYCHRLLTLGCYCRRLLRQGQRHAELRVGEAGAGG